MIKNGRLERLPVGRSQGDQRGVQPFPDPSKIERRLEGARFRRPGGGDGGLLGFRAAPFRERRSLRTK